MLRIAFFFGSNGSDHHSAGSARETHDANCFFQKVVLSENIYVDEKAAEVFQGYQELS